MREFAGQRVSARDLGAPSRERVPVPAMSRTPVTPFATYAPAGPPRTVAVWTCMSPAPE